MHCILCELFFNCELSGSVALRGGSLSALPCRSSFVPSVTPAAPHKCDPPFLPAERRCKVPVVVILWGWAWSSCLLVLNVWPSWWLFKEVSDRSVPGSRRCLDLLWSRVPVWGPSISEEACGNCGKFFSCRKWNSYPEPRFSGALKRGLWDHELDSKLHETAAQKAGVRSLPCFINV